MSNPKYIAYIHSPQWKELRLAALKRDGFKCQICGSGKNLHVHHFYYPNDLFTEDSLDYVITVCEDCHDNIHKEDVAPSIKKYLPNFIPWEEATNETCIEYICNHITASKPPIYLDKIKKVVSKNVTEKYIDEIKKYDISNGGYLNLPILLGHTGTPEQQEAEMKKDEMHISEQITSDYPWNPLQSPVWELSFYIEDILFHYFCSGDWIAPPMIDETKIDIFLNKCIKKQEKPQILHGKKDYRIGEKKRMKSGLMATVKKYRLEYDIDVELEDGTMIYHTTYSQFKNGTLRRNNKTA